ncbi:hypothetical protein [Blautia sp.]
MNTEYTLVDIFAELMGDESWESDETMRVMTIYNMLAWGIFPVMPNFQ